MALGHLGLLALTGTQAACLGVAHMALFWILVILGIVVLAKWLAGGTVPGILEVPVFVQTAEG